MCVLRWRYLSFLSRRGERRHGLRRETSDGVGVATLGLISRGYCVLNRVEFREKQNHWKDKAGGS